MKRTIDYLKNLKEDITYSIDDACSTTITVDINDLRHLDEALADIENLKKERDMWKQEAESCKLDN